MAQSGIVISGTFEKQHAVGSVLGGLRGLKVLPVFERLQVVVFPERAGYRVTLHLNEGQGTRHAIERITSSWGQLKVIEEQGAPVQNDSIILKGVFKKHRGPSGLVGAFQENGVLPHVRGIEFTILAEGAGYRAKVSIAKHAEAVANIARILHFFKELRVAQD